MSDQVDEDIFDVPKPPTLDRRLELLARNSKEEYYFLAVSRSLVGMNDWHIFSKYDHGSSEKIQNRKLDRIVREYRMAREVHVDDRRFIIDVFEKISKPIWLIAKPGHLMPFYLAGGPALISHSAINALDPRLLKSYACIHGLGGWFAGDVKYNGALWSAPSASLRTRVMDRDGFRCLLCGETPRLNVHIQLQLHHVKPLCDGGLTEYGNLMTICHTCHQGVHSNEIDLRKFMPDVGRSLEKYGPSVGGKLKAKGLDRDEFDLLEHLFSDAIFLQTKSDLNFLRKKSVIEGKGMYFD